jgi:hypothetical protein
VLDKPPSYRTYLIRCWEERSRDTMHPTVWRFSLEDPHTGRRRGFASLEDMLAFLKGELAASRDRGTDPRRL